MRHLVLARALFHCVTRAQLGTAHRTCSTTLAMMAEGPSSDSLQALWASAYEGWVSPPGSGADDVVYLAPIGGASDGLGAAAGASWIERTLVLADEHGGLYGLTAFNPAGQDRPHKENMAQNLLLEAEIEQLCAATGGSSCWWRSFGFAADWHEKGFTVAARQEDVVSLAKKYGQGAVYRFYRTPTSADAARVAPFMRETVPALLPDTEADVPVAPSPRPGLERADAKWAPAG